MKTTYHTKRMLILATVVALLGAACSASGDSDTTDTTSGATRIDSGSSNEAPDDRDATGDPQRIDRSAPNTIAAPATTAAPSIGAPETTVAADTSGDASSALEYRSSDIAPRERRIYGNDFVDPIRDNFSTFAVDVDTGAYTLMRAWINEGRVPFAENVRVEEYVNYFDNNYSAPTDETFAIYADGGPTPFWDRRNDVLRIGIKAKEITERRRSDLNLTFVIDVSGSMGGGGKLTTVKRSLETLVRELDRFDEIAIVAYNTEAWVELEPTPADDLDTILRAIDRLRDGGSTNAEGGLTLGYDLADEMFDGDEVNRVVLLSDGVANVGNTGPEAILRTIGDRARDGIGLVTVGVGIETYNDALLEQLADQGDGWYAYVDNQDEAVRLFRERLVETFETVARDAKVQVDFDPNLVLEYRLIGFENRDIADEDFRNDRVDAGDLNAGHSVTALYEVALTRDAYRSDEPFATVALRWEDPNTGRVDEISGEVTSDVLVDRFESTDPWFQVATTVAAYAEVLRGSRWLDADLDDIAREAERLPLRELRNDEVDEFVDLVIRASHIVG